VLRGARVVPQPGDGSCLFHSLAHGLGLGLSKASALRKQLSDYMAAQPTMELADSPLSDWILWDSGLEVAEYAARMRSGPAWGGAIEMAVCARLKGVDVCVYERGDEPGALRCITRFRAQQEGTPQAGGAAPAEDGERVVRLLYGGRVHYDAIETGPGWWDKQL
jgi:hypothetical protein